MLLLVRLLSILTVFLCPAAYASNVRSQGMAMEGISQTDDPALFANPAAPGDTSSVILQASVEDRYGIALLRNKTLACAAERGAFRAGAQFIQIGNMTFNRSSIHLAIGTTLFRKARFGIAVSGQSSTVRSAEESVRRMSFRSSTGWWIQALPKTRLGIVIDNAESLFRTNPTADEQPGCRFGLSWLPAAAVNWSVEANQRYGEELVLATGLHYQVAETISFGFGWRSDRTLFSIGAGFLRGPFRIDLAFEQHRQLGTRSSISLIYYFPDKK